MAASLPGNSGRGLAWPAEPKERVGHEKASGAPDRGAEADRRARQKVRELVEKNQDAEYRKLYEVTLPDGPSGLGDDYDVRIFGTGFSGTPLLLTIRCRGAKATAEAVTDNGILRGRLPAKKVDEIARQLIYGYRCEETLKGRLSLFGGGGPSDYRCVTIKVVCRKPHKRTLVCTEMMPAIAGTISFDSGVQGFFHTRAVDALIEMAGRHLKKHEPPASLHAEIAKRLKRLQPDKKPLDDPERMDQRAVEANIYARLAVEWRIPAALPELRRLGLKTAATKLEIIGAENPTELLKAVFRTADDDLRQWAIEFLEEVPPPSRREVLLDALPHTKDDFIVSSVLESLCRVPADAARTKDVAKVYATTKDPFTKIYAAEYLGKATRTDEYYNFLLREALRREKDSGGLRTRHGEATRGVLRMTDGWEAKRKPTVAMVRTLLARLPVSASDDQNAVLDLILALGALGGPADAELVVKFCTHGCAAAINVLANWRPEAALPKARAEVEKYAKRSTGSMMETLDFGWYVAPYCELLCCFEDRAAIGPLEKSLQRVAEDEKEWRELSQSARPKFVTSPVEPAVAERQRAQIHAILRVLRAKGVEERLQSAAAYLREFDEARPFTTSHRKVLVERLVKDGADRIRTKELIGERKPECRPAM